MDFGFTNDQSRYDAALAWKEAAVADGWACGPTYRNEPMERAASLQRDGFKASVITREDQGKWKFEATVHVWGPDGMAIAAPTVYDWRVISAGARRCNYCGADDVGTHRVGFAGRCCAACLPAQRERLEYPGWTR